MERYQSHRGKGIAMKIRVLFFSLILGTVSLFGCPTCIGALDDDAPPFFSEDFYQPNKEKKVSNTQDEGESNETKKPDTDTATEQPA